MGTMLRNLCFGILVLTPLAFGQEEPETEGALVPKELTLAEAKRIALLENPSLKAAEARVKQAWARVRQARASYFPNVDASASISKTWLDENSYRAQRNQAFLTPFLESGGRSSGTSQFPVVQYIGGKAVTLSSGLRARAGVDNSFTTHSAALTAQWLIFDGFAREFTHAASRFGARESEAASLEARRLLLEAVAESYFSAVLAREELAIAEADEAFNARQLEEAEARRRVGTGSLSDELNFRVRVNTAKASRIRAVQVFEVAKVGLAQLMAVPESAFPAGTELAPLLDSTPADLERPDLDTKLASALERRPDLLRDRRAVDRTRAAMRAQRGVFFPTVSTSVSHAASLTNDHKIGQDDFGTTVGLNVSYSLFAGGRNRAQYVESKGALSEAEHNLHSTEIAVSAQVRSAIENLAAAQDQWVLQQENAAHVQKNRDLVEKEYMAGQASLVRLNEAQRDLVSSQAQLAAARVTLQQAWHSLTTATGEILGET